MLDATIAMIPGCVLVSVVGFYMGRRQPLGKGVYLLICYVAAVHVALIEFLLREWFGMGGPTHAYMGFFTFLVWGIAAEIGACQTRNVTSKDIR